MVATEEEEDASDEEKASMPGDFFQDDLSYLPSPVRLDAEDDAVSLDGVANDAAPVPAVPTVEAESPINADLPHDPRTCLICAPAPVQRTAQPFAEGKEEAAFAWRLQPHADASEEVSLLQMRDLLFIIWDYLPLSQVWRFQFLCPRWRELLQLKPEAAAGAPSESREEETAASGGQQPAQHAKRWPSRSGAAKLAQLRDEEMDEEDEAALSEEKEEEEDDDVDDDDRADLFAMGRHEIEAMHGEQARMMQPFQPGVVHAEGRDWREDLRGFSVADLAAILEARVGANGGGRGDERGAALNFGAGLRRPREWHGKRSRTKRMRKVDRHHSSATAAPAAPPPPAGPLCLNSQALQSSFYAAPHAPFFTNQLLRHHRALPGEVVSKVLAYLPSPARLLSPSSSPTSSSSTPPSFSPDSFFSSSSLSSSSSSSSSSPTPSLPSPIALWSSRSYLRRLVHAKLSLLPNCTPWLNPAMLASLFSVTSLHLFSFPFVTPVFSCEHEGRDWSEDEARLHSEEKEAYEREEKRKLQEQNDRERKQLKESQGGEKRERALLGNAAWLMRRAYREEVEDVMRGMEMQGVRRRRLMLRGGGDETVYMEEMRERVRDVADEVERRPARDEVEELEMMDLPRDYPMHPFWYHAAMEKRTPKEVGHLSLLASLAPQLTSLVFSPCTLMQADLATLSRLHSLTSLHLHPHSCEGLRPADALADFLSSLPRLEHLSLYSEEAVSFPSAFMPHLPLLKHSLRSLSVHSSWFSLEAVEAVAALTGLTSLSLSFTSEPLPRSTFDKFASLTQLSSLTLHTGTRLSYALPPSLFALSSLTSLSLFGSINLHQSAFHLLPSLPQLQRLRVSDCFDSLNDVVRHVLDCPQLRLIDVRGTALSWRKREQIRFERTDVRLIDS